MARNSANSSALQSLADSVSIELIDTCSSLTGWSGHTNYSSVLSGQGPGGEDVIRMTVPGASSQVEIRKTISPTNLFKYKFFGQWLRFNDLPKAKVARPRLWRTPYASGEYYENLLIVNAVSTAKHWVNGEWRFHVWLAEDMDEYGGAPVFNSNTVAFDTLGLRAQSYADGGGSVDFGPIYGAMEQNRAIVIISFDDSNDTDYTEAKPYMDNYGFKGTSYVIRDLVNENANYLTFAEAHELQDAGWCIGGHSLSNLPGLTRADQDTELEAQRDWAITNGYTGWKHFAFPAGQHNEDTMDALEAAGYLSAREDAQKIFLASSDLDPFLMDGVATSTWTTAQDGKDDIDKAIQYGATIEIYTHRLQLGGGGDHTDSTLWKAVIDYIALRQKQGLVDVLTKAEFFDWWSNPIPRTDVSSRSTLVGARTTA